MKTAMARESNAQTAEYKAFISYSHAADGDLVGFLQSALQSFAKPWYRRRMIRVFRDTTGLGVTPDLWGSIQAALHSSEYFILLASEQSAKSHWVELELNEWLSFNSAERVLIVWTDGGLAWDSAANDFDWARSTAVHPRLRGVFRAEPLYVDMRWAENSTDLSLRRPEFMDAIARLSATLRQLPLDDLLGEDVRQHRRTRRLAGSAIGALVVLLVGAVAASVVALKQRNEALSRLIESMVANGAREIENGDLSASALWFAEALRLESRGSSGQNLQRIRLTAAIRAHPELQHVWKTEPGLLTRYLAFGRDGQYVITEGVKQETNPATLQDVQLPGDGPRIWDSKTGEALPLQARLQASEHLLAVDASGAPVRLIVAATTTARIVDATTGAELVRLNHSDKVLSASFSPDARLVITESEDRAIRLWDTNNGHLIETLTHESDLTGSGFTPDGRRVLSITGDGTVHVWTLKADNRILSHRSIPHEDPVELVEVARDGRFCITVAGRDARLFDLSPADKAVQLQSWPGVNHVEFSPDGSFFLIADDFGEASVFSVDPVRQVAAARPNGAVLHATFSADGRRFATASTDRVARVWSASTGEPLSPPLYHEDTVTRVAFDADRRLATTTAGGLVRVWQLQREATDLKQESVRQIVYDADGRHLLSANDSQVKIWDLEQTGASITIEPGSQIFYAASSPDGRRVVTANADKFARIYDAASGRLLLSLAHQTRVQHASFSADSLWLVTAGSGAGGEPEVIVWDAITGARLFSLPHGSDWAKYVEFSGNRTQLLTVAGPIARVWDLASRREIFRIDDVRSASFSPDGALVAAVVGAGVKVYDVGSASALPLFIRHDNYRIDRVSFSADSRKLVIVGGGYARLWDARTAAPLTRPLQHGARTDVTFATISADGRFLATASEDGTIRIWYALTGQPVTPALMHKEDLRELAFNPDGSSLAAAEGNAVHIWEIVPRKNSSDDELALTAQALSARKIDTTAAIALLTGDEFRQLWQQTQKQNR